MKRKKREESEENAFREKDEEDQGESLRDFIFEQVDRFFINHIPFESIKDLESTYLYFFGTAAYLIAFAMFAYFFWVNYENSISQAFISLESDAGDCNTVPVEINGNYLADAHGIWNGFPGFSDSEAIYGIEFSNFQINSISQYEQMMDKFYTSLNTFATNQSVHLSLAENLIFWMTYVEYYSIGNPLATNLSAVGYGQLQTFELLGTPAVVFDLDHIVGRVGSISGVCSVQSYSRYDEANHIMTNTFNNASLFIETESCYNAIYPPTFGYYEPVDDNIFSVSLDVDSFSLAISINLGMLNVELLRPISQKQGYFAYKGVNYVFGEYFDIRFPTMLPLYCMRNISIIPIGSNFPQHLCVYAQGTTFALPVFNHYGASSTHPAPCRCESPVGRSNACNEFNLISSLIFYQNDVTIETDFASFSANSRILQNIQGNLTDGLKYLGLFNLFSLLAKYPDYQTFNHRSYNASYWTVNLLQNETESEYRSTFFDFCLLEDGQTCSIAAFNSFDLTSKAVSLYKYQLFNGSCQNSEAIPYETWQKLVNQPPVNFTQIYFECTYQVRGAIVQALGIAQGNTQIFLPFLVFAILPLLYAILVMIRQVPPKDEYREQEKNQATQMLALIMLRLRDGKTRGIKRNGVLQRLVEEMVDAAREEGGFPDSDDEDEADDDDNDNARKQESKVQRPSIQMVARGSDMYPTASQYREDSLMSSVEDVEFGSSSNPSDNNRRSQQESPKITRVNTLTAFFASMRSNPTPTAQQQAAPPPPPPLPPPPVRHRMAVFTKQLTPAQERQQQQQQHAINRVQSTTPFSEQGRKNTIQRMVSNLGFRRSTNLTTGVDSVNTNTKDNNQAATVSTGVFSYFFGSSNANQESAGAKKGSKPTSKRMQPQELFLDLNVYSVPNGITVLNQSSGVVKGVGGGGSNTRRGSIGARYAKDLSNSEIMLLMDDLCKYFTEALNYSPSRLQSIDNPMLPSTVLVNSGTQAAPQDNGGVQAFRMDSVDSGVYHQVTRRDGPSYQQAKQLTTRLQAMNWMEWIDQDHDIEERNVVVLKLLNALTMHTAIEYDCPLKDVSITYGKTVGYEIGQRLVTLSALEKII